MFQWVLSRKALPLDSNILLTTNCISKSSGSRATQVHRAGHKAHLALAVLAITSITNVATVAHKFKCGESRLPAIISCVVENELYVSICLDIFGPSLCSCKWTLGVNPLSKMFLILLEEALDGHQIRVGCSCWKFWQYTKYRRRACSSQSSTLAQETEKTFPTCLEDVRIL